MKKINKEDLELAKEVQYWAGRLIGCENAYDIAEEIVNTIKYAESEINDVDLGSVRLSLPSENDVKEQAKRIIIPYDGYKKDNAQRMIGFKQGAEWMRDKVKDNEA